MAISKRLLKRRSKHTWIRRSIRVTVEIVDLSDIMQQPLPRDDEFHASLVTIASETNYDRKIAVSGVAGKIMSQPIPRDAWSDIYPLTSRRVP